MKSFLPEFIACICGVALGYGVRLWAKTVRVRRAMKHAAATGAPPQLTGPAVERAENRTDLIAAAICIAAVLILGSTTTPKGWQIAFFFGYLWPVILHYVLRYPERIVRHHAARAEAGARAATEEAGSQG